jgi:hypothetical protein
MNKKLKNMQKGGKWGSSYNNKYLV